MGFRQDAFAKVWSVTNNGNYSTANLTVSKRPKGKEEYEVVFKDGFVRFVGEAHQKISGVSIPENKGVSIKILSCDVENRYDANTKKLYTNYAIYDFEFPDSNSDNGAQAPSKTTAKPKQEAKSGGYTEVNDDELPF